MTEEDVKLYLMKFQRIASERMNVANTKKDIEGKDRLVYELLNAHQNAYKSWQSLTGSENCSLIEAMDKSNNLRDSLSYYLDAKFPVK